MVFRALHVHSIRSKKHDRSLNMLLHHFRKYQLFHAFRKMNLQTNRVAEIRDKSKIDGAYLILRRLKDRLKAFDVALQALNKAKVNISDFKRLETSLDMARAEIIFEDMKRLFDTASVNFEARITKESEKTTALFQKLLGQQREMTANID